MSLDLPINVERDIERYAQAEHLTPTEAAVKLIQSGLKANRRTLSADLVTDEQIRQLKALDSSFGLLEDVSEESIDRMAATIQGMKQEGFTARA
ncbi:MAG: hypothetical protein EON58_04670 [Alphaproteobacteria bacterium]|nr:MAG: hypothetical protein EON58_04670 [Alphaproteobacteria bacterium]